MERYLFCYQNAAREYFDHIVVVPDDFLVNFNCLCGVDKQEFITGLKALTSVVKEIYDDMIKVPDEYGLPLVEDKKYELFNPKAAESGHSAKRVITLLHVLANCGALENGKIVVNKNDFTVSCKKVASIYKITNSNKILKKLCDFGFVIERFNGKGFDKTSEIFTFSHIDELIAPVLYGFMNNTPLKKQTLFSLNYNLAIAKSDLSNDYCQAIFAEYVSGEEREFYKRLDATVEEIGLVIGSADDYNVHSYRIEYVINTKAERRVVRCYSDNGKLRVGLYLRNINTFEDIIETLPEYIKQVFRVKSTCRDCNKSCKLKIAWELEGVCYAVCGYQHYFFIPCGDPNDMEYYKRLIQMEVEATTKARKKL